LIALLHTKYDNALHIIEKCLIFFIFSQGEFLQKETPRKSGRSFDLGGKITVVIR